MKEKEEEEREEERVSPLDSPSPLPSFPSDSPINYPITPFNPPLPKEEEREEGEKESTRVSAVGEANSVTIRKKRKQDKLNKHGASVNIMLSEEGVHKLEKKMELSDAVSNYGDQPLPSTGLTGGSSFETISPGTGITSMTPDEQYKNRADHISQSVTDAQRQLDMRSVPSQAYANQVQNDLIADYHGYMTDKNYQGKYSAAEVLQGYDYLSRANNGVSDLDWAIPKADDQLFTQITPAPRWEAARSIQEAASAQYNASTPTRDDAIMQSVYRNNNFSQAQQDVFNAQNIEHGDWNALSWIDKAKALFVPGSSRTGQIDNMPSWAKYITNIFPSIMASDAGAAIGSAIAPDIGALTVGGLT